MRIFRRPRAWLLLGLIVASTGTPFRLAEAASDLARSMAEPDEAGAIAEVDGGVGDDSGEVVRLQASGSSLDSPSAGLPAPPGTAPADFGRHDPRDARTPGPVPRSPGPRPHALNCRFLC